MLATYSNTSAVETLVCRLCQAEAKHVFSKQILQRLHVKYYRCSHCLSLQTEDPYWLDDSYNDDLFDLDLELDVGAAHRTLRNLPTCYFLSRLHSAPKVIDLGGRDGLLCRLLRDYGVNCFLVDKYAKPTYARGFTLPDFERPDLVCAFEVLEHFRSPRTELDAIFASRPKLVIATTEIYTDQGPDWLYLSPERGQHVFFYSKQSLRLIANRYGMKLLRGNGFIVFADRARLSMIRQVLTKLILKERVRRLLQALLAFRATPNVQRDYLLQRSKSIRP